MESEKELSLAEIHDLSLVLLRVLEEICDKININYFLGFGSLLGAVRHHGFIPWDDDFDIFMKRLDYERFIKYCVENKNKILPYEILDYRYTKDYPYPIARFSDSRYRAVFDNMNQFRCGAFIDIYPLDGIGTGGIFIQKYLEKMRRHYKKLIRFSYQTEEVVKNEKGIKYIIKNLIVSACRKRGSQYYCKKLDKLGHKYDKYSSDYLSLVVWNDKSFVCKSNCFENFLIIDFENIKVKIPIGYDEILSEIYGDYMKLPPMDQQIPHHNYHLYKCV